MLRRIVSFAWLLAIPLLALVVEESAAQGKPESWIYATLDAQIDMKDFQAQMTLKEALGLLSEKLGDGGTGKELPILVDSDAFKQENPNSMDVYDTPIKFPPFPKRISLALALRTALQKVPDANATYLVYPTHIVITTTQRATPQ